jgi:hypothetical protein
MIIHAHPNSGLALLFEPQSRPSADDVVAMIAATPAVARVLSISHRPAAGEGWLEVLCRGLTFDITGLAPARPDPLPSIQHHIGFAADSSLPGRGCECLHWSASGGRRNLLPVVRAHVEVGRALMSLPGVRAAVWCPAEIAMSPEHFERVVSGWLNGGVPRAGPDRAGARCRWGCAAMG